MPARQDQTLQIFLIVFIFLFLVCAVVAYLGWKGASEAQLQATTLQNSLTDKETQLRNKQVELEETRVMTGFQPTDSPESVKTAFDADMKRYGAGVAEEGSRFYKSVLEAVYNDAQNTAAREAALKVQLSDVTKAMQALQGQTAAAIAQIEDARKQTEADKASEKRLFDEARAKMQKNEAQLAARLGSQKDEFAAQLSQVQTQKKALEEKIVELERQVRNLNEQRKDEPGSFEVADGRISRVNQIGTVWINLGRADSLRRQVTFSVYDVDQHDAAKAEKKGSIEVTRIMGEHMAEAKITEDNATNPILTGDRIYSQVWHRGKKLRFALTGFVDFDDDGRSDMQLARELIEMNDGIVDAYQNDDGVVEGKITANTRYLLLGDSPELATQVKLQKGWNEMSEVAASLGVETITIGEFLSQMGYKPHDRTVKLGEGATAGDFPARPEDSSRPVAPPRFRQRTPYRAPTPAPR